MNLHDDLGRYGADAVAGSRSRLESVEVRQTLSARVRRGRRKRAMGGGLGAVAGVAVVAVGLWTVMPGAGDGLEPATLGEPVTAGPYRYDVDAADPVDIAEPEVLLRGDGAVMCGDEVSLTPGVTVHDELAFERGIFLEAELATLGEISPYDPPATPEPIDPTNPDGPTNDWDPAEPRWTGWLGGTIRRGVTSALLLDGETVVGEIEGSSGGGPEGYKESSLGSPIPRVGSCEVAEQTWDGLMALERGDAMNTLLVTQFWGAGEPGDRVLLATIVVDPNEPANTSTPPRERPQDDFPERDERTDDGALDPVPGGQAELLPPEGNLYQAFVVPAPAMGCAPFADQLAAGHPGADTFSYNVELPGVAASLTGELWGADPVVILPAGEEHWYQGLDAWVVVDGVSAGVKDPHLNWTSLSVGGWALSPGGDDPRRGDDCAHVEPIPELSGAVFLIFNGADMGAIEDAGIQVRGNVEPSGLYTWIYLGEAEPIEY